MITSEGYDGEEHEIGEAGWAEIASNYGSDYGVRGYAGAPDEDAGKVTVVSSADRTVAVAPAVFYGHGVRDVSDETVNVQLPLVTGSAGTKRWFLVAARRNWQDNLTTVSRLDEGQATATLPATRLKAPGVKDDQPLALVEITAGESIPSKVIDLRCWSGNAGITAASVEALSYLNTVGSRVTVGTTTYSRLLSSAGSPEWVPSTNQITYSQNFVALLNGAGGGSLSFPNGGFPNACTGITIQSRDGSSTQLFKVAIIHSQLTREHVGFVVRTHDGRVVTGHRRFTYIAVGN